MRRKPWIGMYLVILFIVGLVGCTQKVVAPMFEEVYYIEDQLLAQEEASELAVEAKEEVETQVEEMVESIKRTVAILGVDGGQLRPDALMVVRFDTATGSTDIFSVPRDTKVVWSERQKEAMQNEKGYAISVCKINEMLVYAGKNNIKETLLDELENILELTIDNYVIVSLDAFKNVIDAIGGVELDVPQRMYYIDPYQDLYIDLYPGVQVLDGDKAEQFVRFRSYPEGDVARVRTQQMFLKALADKVLSPQMIFRIPQLVSVLFDAIDTDIGFVDAMKYVPLVTAFDPSQITYTILPGEGRYENGVSYFFVDEQEKEALLKEIG